ncbi:SNF1-activating kinase 1 [Spathaspora sp. JA1]|nr:SNF1-activating kinase 1 [Spathaspora sp. JA1]
MSSPLMQNSPAINTHNNVNSTTTTTTTTTAATTKESFIFDKASTNPSYPTLGITFDPIPTDYTHHTTASSQCSPLGSPRQFPQDDFKHSIFHKVNGIFSTNDSNSSLKEQQRTHKRASSDNEYVPPLLSPRSRFATTAYSSANTPTPQGYRSFHSSPVKETNRVLLEYDPINRRKVLNTYEILREIGRGEHGKVKLARDLINNDYVAIKIVNRKSKWERPSLRIHKRNSNYEIKIKREIAIMKKCRHKHIVSLREVLDDMNSYKIYLVLEYMEKGEIKWKRSPRDKPEVNDNDDIPCCGSLVLQHKHKSLDENDLLSNEFSPNLTFKQARRIFRDVLLGLEYLHLNGIVHRDIKPANLLVSRDNIVKISDFGVSFASSLTENEPGHVLNELDLAKTAGTPAFFAPELCRFGDISSTPSVEEFEASTPKIDYKIDIWALGVTLYCILFGKVPFNADSEYELFQVIVNQEVEFPENKDCFNSPSTVTDEEFNLAKDLLSKLLDKNNSTRIDITQIKEHPFTLMDLENDFDGLNELFTLNQTYHDQDETTFNFELHDHDIVSKQEIDDAIIGIGTRIKRNLVRAIKAGGSWKDQEIRNKFAALQLEHSKSGSSEESSGSGYSNYNSQTKLNNLTNLNHSMILSEGLSIISTPPPPAATASAAHSTRTTPHIGDIQHPPHVPSALAHQLSSSSTSNSSGNPYSFAGIREVASARSFLHEMIESHSNGSSRRGSCSTGGPEAPQIETKRNVGGDLYLKNQSVVETFKGIQQQDDKRRRSSLFSLHSQNSTKNNSISSTNDEKFNYPYQHHQHHHQHQSIAAPIPVPIVSLKNNSTSSNYNNNYNGLHSEISSRPSLKVGPITHFMSNATNTTTATPITKEVATIIYDGNPESSVMSLPLSASYASLDSINDEYLSMKYEEFTNSRKLNCQSEALPETTTKPIRKSSLSETNLDQIDVNFDIKEINQKFKTFNLEDSMKSNPEVDKRDDDVAPRTKIKYSWSSSSTGSSSSSSSSKSDSDDEEEEENLTLAFTSKVRPSLFNFHNRAISHESNLPRLGHTMNVTDIPTVVFHGTLPEFEDVPMNLMEATPTSGSTKPAPATVEVPVDEYNTASQATLTAEGLEVDPSIETTLINPNDNEVKRSNRQRPTLRENIFHNQFNNHYKKAPIYSPFPSKSRHLDNDKKSINKELLIAEINPGSYRSNSISLGLLQHERHLLEMEDEQ